MTEHLTLSPNLTDPDTVYDLILKAHDGLTKEESDALNARLILVLANHIGDADIIAQALEAAKDV